MKYVNYPFNETKRLSFYLATEEFLAKHYPKDEYFFMWQVKPTVIFGRNQLIENEVNMDYVKENNIEFYRRKSGGGCVYADYSNIMFSFITPNFNKDFVFTTYLSRIINILRDLGLDANFSGRNDILVGDLKVSGNAFYQVNSRSVVHGTMLYNTDLAEMVKAITPDNEKLVSRGIDSVRKRVTNVKDHIDISIEDFKAFIKKNISDEDITLSESDIKIIEDIEKTYLADAFIYGKNPNYTLIKKGKVKAGLFEISLEIKNKLIKKMNILGDYFIVQDEEELINLLINKEYDLDKIKNVLDSIDVSNYIYDLSNEDFLSLLFKE
ncbi:MAG: lipoate--protein ligase [Candidatus Izemoplasmatales bacterium]|uniref:lipoate--protein ligase n=1 Tax=Hujiaoplasma nucleasis TaxID=2725268 RepID=A0A7L6MZT7_9MOLU|nr:lipoate--protein ligase [Hujiaoplasma nucleasis]QLY39516.1 lipoate--protein ligase [Hujiaoplasma nucleasis]